MTCPRCQAHAIEVARTGDVVIMLSWAVASSAWVLGQLGEARQALSRLRGGEPLVEHQTARGVVSLAPWIYHAPGRAALLLGHVAEAQRLGDRAITCSCRHHGYMAHTLYLLGDIATHPDRFDGEHGQTHYPRRWPSPSRAACAPSSPTALRPREALPAHQQARAGPRAPRHRAGDVPRYGHGVLACPGAGRR